MFNAISRSSVVFLGMVIGHQSAVPANDPPIRAEENVAIWPDLAPGETSRNTGTAEVREGKGGNRPITLLTDVRRPTLDVFPASNPNGVGVLILPGGGFAKVVPDLEGSEAAAILNQHGISAFVLRYRTKKTPQDAGWKRPLQDTQRAMAWLRANAAKYNLNKNRIGLFGFSAGGQVAARMLTDAGELAYPVQDDIDAVSHRADFGILIYPWNMYDKASQKLDSGIKVTKEVPPTFIVHTHDDHSSSLGSVLFYAGIKQVGGDAELHVYRNGGHGYGTRSRPNSDIGTWPDRMVDWLKTHSFAVAR